MFLHRVFDFTDYINSADKFVFSDITALPTKFAKVGVSYSPRPPMLSPAGVKNQEEKALFCLLEGQKSCMMQKPNLTLAAVFTSTDRHARTFF